MLSALQAIAASNGGLVSRKAALAAGVTSQRLTELVRRGVLARVARGVYVVASGVVEARDLAAICRSWLVVLSHLSAAAWWGVDLPAPPKCLHVMAPRSRHRRRDAVRGVRLHRASTRAGDVCVLRGVRVTSPLRTALDIARTESTEYGVAIVDAFMRAGLFSAEEFAAVALRSAGPGRVRILRVVTLVDAKSGSILESLTRVLLWRHGLAPECSQYEFRHRRSGWVGYLDFAWPSVRAALECDGYEYHADRTTFQRDRRRWSAINRTDWRLGVVTWFDVMCDPHMWWRWCAIF